MASRAEMIRASGAAVRSVAVLMGLLEDEQVVEHAFMALGKLKDQAAQSRLTELTGHPAEWVRKEAKKALANLRDVPLN